MLWGAPTCDVQCKCLNVCMFVRVALDETVIVCDADGSEKGDSDGLRVQYRHRHHHQIRTISLVFVTSPRLVLSLESLLPYHLVDSASHCIGAASTNGRGRRWSDIGLGLGGDTGGSQAFANACDEPHGFASRRLVRQIEAGCGCAMILLRFLMIRMVGRRGRSFGGSNRVRADLPGRRVVPTGLAGGPGSVCRIGPARLATAPACPVGPVGRAGATQFLLGGKRLGDLL